MRVKNTLKRLIISLGVAIGCMTGFMGQALASNQEIIIGIGKGMDDTLIQSKSIADAEQWEFSWSWDLDKSSETDFGYAQWWIQAGYLELSGEHLGVSDELSLIQLKPILRLYPAGKGASYFVEAGLGAAKLSKKSFEQIIIKTKGNFVIHAAFGWELGENSKLSLRYSHYSNGYTHTPNPGIDTLAINFHWSLD